MTLDNIFQKVKHEHIRFVRFLYCDNGGIIRGKSAYAPTLTARMTGGIGLTVAMQAMNSLDQLQPMKGMGPVGEVRLVPDASTFRILPYAPHSAAVLTDMTTLEGNPWEACPRSFLARMELKARALGITVLASIENEFSLILDDKPWDDTLCFSSQGMLASQEFVDELAEDLDHQGIVLEQYYPELAPGQHEISVRHQDAMRAADQQIYTRETIRAVAANHGLRVSFAPKPWVDQAGNGGHIHFSLVDEAGNNLIYEPHDPYQLSPLGYEFMAGILFHLPALLALTAPTVNSYQRLVPNTWSGGYSCWGPDNREAPLRIASPLKSRESQSVNIELKAADLSANPYLALGGLIAAGLDGITQHREIGKPALVNPDQLTDHERQIMGIVRLPQTLSRALDYLTQNPVLTDALGDLLLNSYVAVKRSEVAFYDDKSPDDIAAWHRFRY
ncbi:MAG: glutamine synthetase family protein [Firmicutes bacterium]|jgi:glutamine synthetase|uniref:Glutamine synthetase n=1 Tax=Sulfobacillus benefaciens TaxID=453960 RepID=A0A2T2WVI0_9FIRM|nr:glutamine synthetase family protein [Bacillota bacterium]MCL5015426.1 glutamine synthetase family protein [Bacillota bacterium]PSR26236.1 MAG: glutamine synthetase [Sulfobacillus benefaciens]